MKILKKYCITALAIMLMFTTASSQPGFYQMNSGISSNLNFIFNSMVVGNNGTILTLYGENWLLNNSNTINNLYGFYGVLACGANGTVLKRGASTNNWVIIPTGYSGDLNDIYYSDNSINACTSEGSFLRSTNGGFNWIILPTGYIYKINRFIYYDDSTIIAVCDGGKILKKTSGTSWQIKNSGVGTNLNDIVQGTLAYNSYYFIAGDNGTILRSSDIGETWQLINLGITNNINSIYMGNGWRNLTWIAGDNGYAAYSADTLGIQWLRFPTNVTNNLSSITSLGKFETYAVGTNGLIIHSTIPANRLEKRYIDANQIKTWFSNSGSVNTYFDNDYQPKGFEWPKGAGNGKNAIYASGLWLSCKVEDSLRTAISYSDENEYYPGYINFSNQMPYGKLDPAYRFYKVSPLYPNGNSDYDSWSLWPINQGAEWIDSNHNGNYEPPIDRPLMKGDQNLFAAFTDGFQESHFTYAGFTQPMNADIHFYAFAVNNPACADAVYMEWKIINKKNKNWDSLHVGIWSDPDLGDASNDKTACDTVRNIGINYNGSPDFIYPNNPPAFGYALYNVTGHQGRLMDVFNNPRKNTYEPHNPAEVFNIMKGLKPDGTSWINPITNQTSSLLYSGDPESGMGWLYVNYGEDTRLYIGSYIGTVEPLDTIKFYAVAYIKSGINHLNAVTELKNCTNQGVIGIPPISQNIPERFELYQNYPNPFNPITKLRFVIPASLPSGTAKAGIHESIRLVIYNSLGQEVNTLVNDKLQAGIYEVEFDGRNYSSGVYYYSLIVGNNIIETRKMVILK